jgi:multiple sugar transport system ATP-binding protein
MAEIRVEHLHRAFEHFVAVQDSSFTIHQGEFFMLLGPSGCGKTTTLRMIAGLERPTSGIIRMDGEDVTHRRASERDIAFVFQMFALYPHLNVRRNIAYPLVSQGVRRAEIRARIAEVAQLLRISDLLELSVNGLSSGDRQRVALARAIVRRPRAFLMDEPLGALDAEFREHMAQELRALHERIGATTVYVTHDQLEAMQMGDRIVVMRAGHIEQIGTPQTIYAHPASTFVADFIGSPAMNLLPARGPLAPGDTTVSLDGGADQWIPLPIPPMQEGTATTALWLGVRPEHVQLVDNSPVRAQVVTSEYLGTTQVVTLELPATDPARVPQHSRPHPLPAARERHTPSTTWIRARLPARQTVRSGSSVGLVFDTPHLSVFDGRTGQALRTAANAAALSATLPTPVPGGHHG